jgi:hypothetical protein
MVVALPSALIFLLGLRTAYFKIHMHLRDTLFGKSSWLFNGVLCSGVRYVCDHGFNHGSLSGFLRHQEKTDLYSVQPGLILIAFSFL